MKDNSNPRKIKYYLLKELPTIILTLFFGVGYNILFVFAPSFQGKLLDTIIDGQPINAVLLSATIFLAVVVSVQITRFLKRLFVRRFANKTKRTMRYVMYQNAINQSLDSLDRIEVGDLMSRCIGDVDITVEGIRKSMTEILDTGVAMISYVVMLMIYDPKATSISCIFIVLSVAIALVFTPKVAQRVKIYRESESKLTKKSYEITSNAMLFRQFGVMDKQTAEFDKSAQDTKAKSIRASLIDSAMPSLYGIVAVVGVIVVIYFGGKKVLDNVWTIGKFSAYLSLFLAFALKASKVSKLVNSVQRAKISWVRTQNYLSDNNESCGKVYVDEKAQEKDILTAKDAESSDNNEALTDKNIANVDSKSTLIVQNMSFAYDDNQVFEPISFSASEGEIVGLVGKIASGKTTALVALTNLYGYLGEIKFNGANLNEFSRQQLAKIISYSGHNSFLLEDTIEENIRIGRDIDVDFLLMNVCFDKDLADMPSGKKTVVGERGVRLSGGQQSRISLARALGGANKIVLLDDPFSAVDQPTEQAIINNLRQNFKDKIFIITSHRSTVFEYADKIVEIISAGKDEGGQNA